LGKGFDIRLYEVEFGIASKVPTLYEWLGGSELLSALIERFHERFCPNSRDDRIGVENPADVSGAGLAASQIGQSLQLAITKDKAEYQATLAAEEPVEREPQPLPFHVLVNPRLNCCQFVCRRIHMPSGVERHWPMSPCQRREVL